MDIIFNCPKCEQELAVDSTGAGSEINCPACGEKIVIPAAAKSAAAPAASHPAPPHAPHDAAHPVNPIATSAAAKVEMHLKVPVGSKPTESLIGKPNLPLECSGPTADSTTELGPKPRSRQPCRGWWVGPG